MTLDELADTVLETAKTAELLAGHDAQVPLAALDRAEFDETVCSVTEQQERTIRNIVHILHAASERIKGNPEDIFQDLTQILVNVLLHGWDKITKRFGQAAPLRLIEGFGDTRIPRIPQTDQRIAFCDALGHILIIHVPPATA